MYDPKQSWAESEYKDYESFEAVVEDGWIVD
jgi:hypothetical protein